MKYIYFIILILLIFIICDYIFYKKYLLNNLTKNLKKDLNDFKNFKKFDINYKFKKGIVLFIDNDNFYNGFFLIESILYFTKSLPILVYIFKDNLNPSFFNLLNQKENCFLFDIKKINSNKFLNISQIKSFLILNCPLEEVLLLDSHILLIKNPLFLFDDINYIDNSLLFWKDKKTIFRLPDQVSINWIKNLIPYKINHKVCIQTNKLILINKKKINVKFLNNLFNLTKNITDLIPFNINIENDIFWISAELSNLKYSFIDTYPGIIGQTTNNTITGYDLFFDSNFQPLALLTFDFNDKNTLLSEYKLKNYSLKEKGSFLLKNSLYNCKSLDLNKSLKTRLNNLLFISNKILNIIIALPALL